MRSIIVVFALFWGMLAGAQIHNRLVKVNVGYSSEQIDLANEIKTNNDTSLTKFEFVSKVPTFSYTHEYILGNVLSLSGKIGFQYLNIFYNNQHYGSPYIYASINPALSLFYRKKFEYYIKLQVGVSYWFNKPELLPDISRRIFPEKASIFTGVTIGGFNYYFSDKMGANLELSLWSPEILTVGLSYRFFKGEIPTIQELQDL